MDSPVFSTETRPLPGSFPSPIPLPADAPRTPENRGHASSPNDFTASSFNRRQPLFAKMRSESPPSFKHTAQGRCSKSRPACNRRPASDPRHKHIRDSILESDGSPIPRFRHGNQTLPGNSENPEPSISQSSSADPTDPAPPPVPSPTVQISPQQVHEKLRSRLNKVTPPQSGKGVVYIFRNSENKLLKIGKAANPHERGQKIKKECKIQLEIVHTSAELEDYGRAESLAQGDLWGFCRLFSCKPCSREHREWHEVDDEVAKKTVDRWVKFIKEEKPYDSGGNLKGLWKFLFSERQQAVPRDAAGHKKRWENVALTLESPSIKERTDYAWFVISKHPIWAVLWEFPWQVSTVIPWLIMFLIVWNSVVFLILAIYVGLAWFSMSPHFKRGLKLKGLGRR